jgi:hypothetical protein
VRFAWILLLVACASEVEPPPPPPPTPVFAPIRTDQSHYAFRHAFFGPETTIVATLHARQNLYVVNCNGAIMAGMQRLVGGKWVQAWGAVTNACLSEPIVIAAGKTHTDPIILRPGAGAVIYPKEARQLIEPGTYRVVWHGVLTSFDFRARPLGPEVPVEQRASAPFVIEGPPPEPNALTSFEPYENTYVKSDARVRVVATVPVRVWVDGVEVALAGDSYAPPDGWTSGRHGVLVRLANGESFSWAFLAEASSP